MPLHTRAVCLDCVSLVLYLDGPGCKTQQAEYGTGVKHAMQVVSGGQGVCDCACHFCPSQTHMTSAFRSHSCGSWRTLVLVFFKCSSGPLPSPRHDTPSCRELCRSTHCVAKEQHHHQMNARWECAACMIGTRLCPVTVPTYDTDQSHRPTMQAEPLGMPLHLCDGAAG